MDWSVLSDYGLPALIGGIAAALVNTILAPAFDARRRRWERAEERRLRLADICATTANKILAARNEPYPNEADNKYLRLGEVDGLRDAAESGYDLGLPRTERDAHRLLRPAYVALDLGQPEDADDPELVEGLRDAAYLLRRPPWKWLKRIQVRRRLSKRLAPLGISDEEVPEPDDQTAP